VSSASVVGAVAVPGHPSVTLLQENGFVQQVAPSLPRLPDVAVFAGVHEMADDLPETENALRVRDNGDEHAVSILVFLPSR
jgi:hypothetical protein